MHPTLEKWHQVVANKDMALLQEILADDCVFHSPILHTPQRGRQMTTMYLSGAAMLLANDTFTYVREVVDGNEMVLAYLNKGQFFGEMGLFYEQPTRSAWVRTRTECEIAEMTYPRFRQIASESPGLVFELATQLATRLDRTNRKLGDLAFVDVTGRVAHAIMDLCNEPDAMTHPDGMQIKVSRQELSRLVGCSREMAGRVLKVLEEQGLVTASGKTIVVYGARPNRNL